MPIPSLSQNQLQATCDVLGDTDSGLTGSRIGRLLAQCRIEDVGPLLTKRFRLYEALSAKQRQDGCANNVVAFISLRTETERSEHTGLMNLMKGLAGAFRNPSAHAPKITWPIVEQEALDILTLVSMLHRRLDAAVVTQPAAP